MSLSSLKASRVRILLALGLVASVLGAASVSWLVAHAQSVGAGQSHSAVLKTGGTIAIWGYNGYGQIGDGTNTQRNVPVELTGTYSAIALGSIHTLALKSDGTVWAWGYNGYGQLGDGTTTGRISPVQVTGLTGVVAISAGDGHSDPMSRFEHAITNDGFCDSLNHHFDFSYRRTDCLTCKNWPRR